MFLSWTHDDRAKAIGWQRDQLAHCSSCGQRRSDWQDSQCKELTDPPFELVESVCQSCAVLEEWREEKSGNERKAGSATRPGLYPAFRRIPEAEVEG